MLYVMRSDNVDTGVMLMNRPVIPGHDDVRLDQGTRFDTPLPRFDFVLDAENQGEVFDFVWTTFPGLVMSARFRKVLEETGVDNLDYYPVRIVNEVTGKVKEDYFAANVLGRVACMDLEKSQYTKLIPTSKQVHFIDEMYLDYSKVQGFKLFRLDESFPLVLADESVKKAVEKAKLRGVRFVPADGYAD
jgi:hypothetical protein